MRNVAGKSQRIAKKGLTQGAFFRKTDRVMKFLPFLLLTLIFALGSTWTASAAFVQNTDKDTPVRVMHEGDSCDDDDDDDHSE